MNFDEALMIRALMDRSEDVRRFSTFFSPSWLQTAQYQPVLEAIYEFTREKGIPPTLSVLRDIFNDQDPAFYENRMKGVLNEIEAIGEPKPADALHIMDKGVDVAKVWSLKELLQSEALVAMTEKFDGEGITRAFESWINQFAGQSNDVECNLKEAIELLFEERTWENINKKIPCGITVIDGLTSGGLKPGNFGLILAPTGDGKSVILLIMSYRMAYRGNNVLLITNELSATELAERYLAHMNEEDITLDQIMDDPGVISLGKLERYWKAGLHGRLRIVEMMREMSMDDVEHIINKYANLHGWRPDVVLIDYMGRMKPRARGYDRGQEWSWYGGIAQEMFHTAKRNKWVIWSACQVNREGLKSDGAPTLSMAQSSTRHFNEASVVVSAKQLPPMSNEDEAKGLVYFTFKDQKLRHGKKSPTQIVVEANLARMSITNKRRDDVLKNLQKGKDKARLADDAPEPVKDDKTLPREGQVRKQYYERKSQE